MTGEKALEGTASRRWRTGAGNGYQRGGPAAVGRGEACGMAGSAKKSRQVQERYGKESELCDARNDRCVQEVVGQFESEAWLTVLSGAI
jgi:hypothetical protein